MWLLYLYCAKAWKNEDYWSLRTIRAVVARIVRKK